jgi:hypothetical protein
MDTANLQSLDLRWGSSNQVDLNTALQFASGAPYSYFNDSAWGQSLQKALAALGGGGGNIGAQNQDWYFQKVEAATKTLSDYYQQKTQELQAINPAFDPTKYENTSYKLYDAGQGEQANRNAPIVRAFNEWSAKIQSLKLAEQAAQQYQSTGVIAPYPADPAKQEAQALVNQWGGKRLDLQDQRVLANAQNILTGEPLSAEAKATANAAAARVGAPLPYPQSGIGQIAGGGIFQSAQEAQQAYTDGKLNQYGQNIASSNSAANKSNDKTVYTMPDGTYQWNGQKYPSKDAAVLAANQAGVTSTTISSSPPNTTNYAAQNQFSGAANWAGSTGSIALVKQALESGDLNNLQYQSWWNSQPEAVRKEAYNMLTSAFQSPEGLASLVQQTGITDLQSKSWWANSPLKQAAWSIIQSGQQSGTTSGSTGTSNGAINANSEAVSSAGGDMQAALDIINKSGLDPSVKALFAEFLQGWQPDKEINAQNIIDEFNKIKSETIDPYFAEQANIFTDEVKRSQAYLNANRELESQSEVMSAQQNKDNAVQNLEASGMTFSGAATDLLGKESAYGMTGAAPTSAIPTQKEFYQFGLPGEGQVQANNRLMASSSMARYQKNLSDLSRSAEQTLGSVKAGGLVPGVQQMGNVTGSLANQQKAQEANTLSALYGQAQQNWNENKQINLFN